MAWYRTLGPVTYTDGGQVRHITKAGIRIDITPAQAAELDGMIVLDRTTPLTYPRADFLKYESSVLFPTEGIEDAVYLANDSGLLYRWINDDYATVGVSTTWGGISGKPAVIAEGSTEADAQAALGGSTVGRAVFTAEDAAAGRTALEATTVGDAVFTATDQAAARAAMGAEAAGAAAAVEADIPGQVAAAVAAADTVVDAAELAVADAASELGVVVTQPSISDGSDEAHTITDSDGEASWVGFTETGGLPWRTRLLVAQATNRAVCSVVDPTPFVWEGFGFLRWEKLGAGGVEVVDVLEGVF